MVIVEKSIFEEFGNVFMILKYQEIQVLDENISLVVQFLDGRVVVRIIMDIFSRDLFFIFLCPFRICIIDAVDREVSSVGV